MAVTIGKLPASAPGNVSYTTSGNNITLTYNQGSTNYTTDYWKIKNSGYQTLEYIEGDGQAYINLDTYPCRDFTSEVKLLKIEMECSVAEEPTSQSFFYGYNGGTDGNRYQLSIRNSATKPWRLRDYAEDAEDDYVLVPGKKHSIIGYAGWTGLHGHVPKTCRRWSIVELDHSIRDREYTGLGNSNMGMASDSSSIHWTAYDNIYLFCRNNKGIADGIIKMRLYNFSFELSPGKSGINEKLELTPVKRLSDGAVGLYDTETDKFYGNANTTGAFIAGPVIQNFVESKLSGNTITTYYNSSSNFEAYACLYDTTKQSRYIEIADGQAAEYSSQCLIKQTLSQSHEISLENQFLLSSTQNGGASWESYKNHVFYAKQDGYIVCSQYVSTSGTYNAIFINGVDKFSKLMNDGEKTTSDFYAFKKGDLIVFASAWNYTDYSGMAVVFYI